MPKHEIKICPRCQEAFECRAGSISICQCFNIQVSPLIQDQINKDFEDCLCANCLATLNEGGKNQKKPNH